MSVRRRAGAAAASLVLIAVVLVASASAASAHALLLRSDPAPQSTAPTAPTVVRLFFSEGVEVSGGDVRVYDVDGKRVDKSVATRKDGNREVDVPVERLGDGTYTVTWRAVSADTHAVHGGFTFYVGHPSSISPVAIDAEAGAPRWVSVGYGIARFAWFAGLLLVVGLVVVRRWVWTPTVRAAGLATTDAADAFRRRFTTLLLPAWGLLLVAGLVQLVFQSATVRGSSSLTDAMRGDALRHLLGASFGHLWLVQTVLALVLLVPVIALSRRTRLAGVPPDAWIVVGGAAGIGLCLVAGLAGHARTASHETLAVASITVHLAAVAVWVGGLAAILVAAVPTWLGVPSDDRRGLVLGVVRRFSPVALVAVAVIAVTGVVNSFAGFSAFSDLWRDQYGRLVSIKVLLILVAVVLAARHRFLTQPRLAEAEAEAEADGDARGSAQGGERRGEDTRFRWAATAELVALVAAVAVAAALVALVPGRTLALAANGPVNQQRAIGSYTVQLIVDPTAVGTNQIHLTYATAAGLAAGEVVNTTATLVPPTGAAAPLPVALISPGHFVGDATLAVPGRYQLRVDGPGASTTFAFTVRKGA
jgi:copper transport protein